MTYRKIWFSYVLWVIYTMLCIIFLALVGNYVCVSYFSELFAQFGSSSLSVYAKDLSGFLLIPAAAVLYWIIRGISESLRRRFSCPPKIRKIIEGIVVLSALTLGIYLRILCVTDPAQIRSGVNGMEYYDMAVVKAGSSIQPLTYGGAYLYVALLSVVLSFLGNKAVSAIILQMALQAAGLILVYLVTRKIAGRIPACTALFYFACSISYREMMTNLGPECLFFVLFLIGMLAMAGVVRYYCRDNATNRQLLLRAAAAGLLFGILGYLDLAAVILLLSMIAGIVLCQRKWSGISTAVVLTAVFTCAAGWFGACFVISLLQQTGMETGIEIWVTQQILNTRTFGFRPLYPYSLDMLLFGILTVLAAFLVFEFFRKGKERNDTLWILLCIIAAPTPMAVLGVQPFGILSMYIWGVLAGLGLQNCIFGGKDQFVKTKIEEINRSVSETDAEEERPAIEAPEPATDVPAQETDPKPRYLENPLPLPKKHVRRQMDYQYKVEEKDMKFDLEIKDDDDFDL